MAKPNVCVVGVGSVGLAAIHWSLSRGFNVQAFERNDGCGGVWKHAEPPSHSPAYDSLFTNSSSPLMNLSDYPFPFKESVFPHHSEILRYYKSYEKAFHLDHHVQYNVTVTNISKDGKKWVVTVNDAQEYTFDAVMVCTGKLWDKRLPDWFQSVPDTIDKLHSKDYRNPERFRGKTVLVVGTGNSALDIALELSLKDDVQVYISCRRGTTILPTKDAHGRPTDQKIGSRFFQYILPKTLRGYHFMSLIKDVNDSFVQAGMPTPPGGMFSTRSPLSNLKQTQPFLEQMKRGRIRFVSGCSGSFVGENGVCLNDGSVLGVDAIVCCTGYTLQLDKFLAPNLCDEICKVSEWKDEKRSVSWLRLYKGIMYPKDPTLCFLGFITSFGNETCIGEMQARWATGLLAGQFPFPTGDKVEQDLKQTEDYLERTKPSVSGFVRYVKYMDSLASDLACKPSFLDVAKFVDPVLLYRFYFGPVVPAHYRLIGKDALSQAPLWVKSRL